MVDAGDGLVVAMDTQDIHCMAKASKDTKTTRLQ